MNSLCEKVLHLKYLPFSPEQAPILLLLNPWMSELHVWLWNSLYFQDSPFYMIRFERPIPPCTWSGISYNYQICNHSFPMRSSSVDEFVFVPPCSLFDLVVRSHCFNLSGRSYVTPTRWSLFFKVFWVKSCMEKDYLDLTSVEFSIDTLTITVSFISSYNIKNKTLRTDKDSVDDETQRLFFSIWILFWLFLLYIEQIYGK